ncbi:MAG: hypothetical protein EPO18_20295 [Methylobacter sp.]|nr:MAG: hypothetical protein EPO18_20295 [Methylobacter sp.]
MDKDHCPYCKASLIGDPIPQEYIDKGYYGEGVTHYRREIGIEDRDLDRCVEYQCPDCGGRWPVEIVRSE